MESQETREGKYTFLPPLLSFGLLKGSEPLEGPLINRGAGGRAGSCPEPGGGAGGTELAAASDSEPEPGCLFWRPGSRTAAATSSAASVQGKAGKIPQSDIVSACGQVRTPNLDSGIWWENGKCIRATEGT